MLNASCMLSTDDINMYCQGKNKDNVYLSLQVINIKIGIVIFSFLMLPYEQRHHVVIHFIKKNALTMKERKRILVDPTTKLAGHLGFTEKYAVSL